ncbi:MAG: aspartyl protease family protein [Cyclobacteriaceae bacterium]|nr:aspartyl protease family protein [Cyclobacteriaceae bacterium]
MRTIASFYIAFMLPFMLHAQEFGFSISDDKEKAEIPFSLHSNLVVIPLVLNNRLPLKFILDTGVRNAILTEKVYSDILGIPYAKRYTIRGVGGVKLVEAYVTMEVSLSLPGVEGQGQTMLVLEEDYIELRNFMGTDVHGMLGYELFNRFVVSINYQKKQLTLINRETFKPKRNYQQIPITIEDTKPYISLPVVFDDGSVFQSKLLVDTGASHGLLLDPESDENIKIPEATIDANIGRGLGGDIEGQIGRIKSLQIDRHLLSDVVVSYPYPDSYLDSLTSSNVFRHGSIGGEILSRFNVVFDYQNEKMYIKKNASFRKPFFYNLSGITLKAKGSQLNVFEVSEVRPSSYAAKSGLQTGDIIYSVNGVLARHLELRTINGFFNSKPKKKIRLVVVRDGEIKKFMFRLENAI